jgi:WD40 repeat protein
MMHRNLTLIYVLGLLLMVCIIIVPSNSYAQTQSYNPIRSLDWSSIGQIAIGYDDGSIQILSNSGQLDTTLNASGNATELAWNSAGDKLAFANPFGSVWIWNATTNMTTPLVQPDEFVRAIVWHPNGSQLAVATQNGTGPTASNLVNIFDVSTGQLIRTINANSQEFYINSLDWNPANPIQIAAGSFLGQVVVWDAQTGNLLNSQSVQRLDPNRDPDLTDLLPSVTSVDWRVDGARFAAGTDDGTVFVWNTTTTPWQQVAAIAGGTITEIEWSSDNKLALIDGRQIRVLNPENQQILTFINTSELANAIAWNTNASQLIYGTDDASYQIVPVPPLITCTTSPTTVAALRTAIDTANSTPATADTLCLSGTYSFTDAPSAYNGDGSNALPSITSPITLVGNAGTATLSRASGSPTFRLLRVAVHAATGAPQVHTRRAHPQLGSSTSGASAA